MGEAQGATGLSGVDRLDHVGIVVTNLDAAVQFFVTWFGARVVFRMERFDDPTGIAPTRLGAPRGANFALAMLEIGGGRFELVQWWPSATERQGSAVSPVPGAVGAAHVALAVGEVSTELDRLREAPGAEVLGEPLTFYSGPTPGLTNAFLRMPWGVLIELVSWG